MHTELSTCVSGSLLLRLSFLAPNPNMPHYVVLCTAHYLRSPVAYMYKLGIVHNHNILHAVSQKNANTLLLAQFPV